MINGEAISHNVQFDDCTGAVSAPVRASIAHLNVNGTDRVASLATKSRTTDQTTRILRSTRSPGQIYGHRWTSVPIRVAWGERVRRFGARVFTFFCILPVI